MFRMSKCKMCQKAMQMMGHPFIMVNMMRFEYDEEKKKLNPVPIMNHFCSVECFKDYVKSDIFKKESEKLPQKK